MATAMVIGAQWGDEGKGKIVDYLAAKADVVVRSQGGNNAGHTVVTGGKAYPLRLMPHKQLFYWFYPAHVYLLYGASCLVYNVLRGFCGEYSGAG